ncbi:MAG: LamB/YcsF family protein [Desulfosudis oleivorans]|nr:LamB/YcsF family protein [Desulfosudis oleivorans]
MRAIRATIMQALKLAKENNLSIGAHIGYPDIQGFGYRTMRLSDEEHKPLFYTRSLLS